MAECSLCKRATKAKPFKRKKIKLQTIEVGLDKPEEYQNDLRSYKQQYDRDKHKHVILRKPTSNWIRQANELLQANFDHHRLYFGSRAIDDSYAQQQRKKIPIANIKFLRTSEESKQSPAAKMIDFVEHQSDMIDLTKNECALIQITTTAQGTQTFRSPFQS